MVPGLLIQQGEVCLCDVPSGREAGVCVFHGFKGGQHLHFSSRVMFPILHRNGVMFIMFSILHRGFHVLLTLFPKPSDGGRTHSVSALLLVAGCYDPKKVNPRTVMPIFDRLFCFLPEKSLYILRCKIKMKSPHEIDVRRFLFRF